MERINNISKNTKKRTLSEIGKKSPEDIVIISALRTPITKSKKGGLNNTTPEQLLSHIFKGLIKHSKIDPSKIGDIQVGNVLIQGSGAGIFRTAQFMAQIPKEVPISSINRQCSSGLEACSIIAAKIKSGIIDVGIGCGVESMSYYDMKIWNDCGNMSERMLAHPRARKCVLGTGEISEIMTDKYGLKREHLDWFSWRSHCKAQVAQERGYFRDEVLPMDVDWKDYRTGRIDRKVIFNDDGVRKNLTLEKLNSLRPVFRKYGKTTAGNSSQMSDGAAGVLLMRRETANRLKMKIIGKYITHAVIGCPSDLMGIGPALAIPKALKFANIKKEDIDIYEINEAFASQCTYCIDELDIPYVKVNPKGGAIAFGHPLGCTGARMICTLIHELKRTGKKLGVVSMCIGTGMGAASIFEAE